MNPYGVRVAEGETMRRNAINGPFHLAAYRVRRLAAGAIALFALTGCAPGESVAADVVDQIADGLTDDFDSPVLRVRDAEWFAASYVPALNASSRGSTVWADTLAWRGNSRDESGARIEVRIRVDVEAEGGYFGASYGPGSVTKCYRYEVFVRPNPVTRSVIACPNDPVITTPSAVPFPTLPDDARDVLAAVLAAASAASLAGDVRAAFPQDFVTVDTEAVTGDLIAAVGVSAERECIVGVRGVDGIVEFRGYDPAWIEPGEQGCSIQLVTSPPQ